MSGLEKNESSPLIRLTTEEETMVSGIAHIPRKEPCTVEFVVIGVAKWGEKLAGGAHPLFPYRKKR